MVGKAVGGQLSAFSSERKFMTAILRSMSDPAIKRKGPIGGPRLKCSVLETIFLRLIADS